MIERVAKAVYDKYNENLIPLLEDLWSDLPEDYKFRLKEGIIAGGIEDAYYAIIDAILND